MSESSLTIKDFPLKVSKSVFMKPLSFFILLSGIILACWALSMPAFSAERLKLATTTSVENTGLIYKLTEAFTEETGVTVDVIAVGTGKALKLGENGDVDVVLVHDKQAEDKFMTAGHGVDRKSVMFNDFVIIGPQDDPAKLEYTSNVNEAFTAIFKSSAPFVSRGDSSGTNMKELAIWKKIGTTPDGSWYKEAGQGMAETIMIADNLKAYTLSDMATFISLQDKISLVPLFEDPVNLKNYYNIIAVNPESHKNVNFKATKAFIKFITSDEAQKIIRNFKVNGKQLFYPHPAK